MRILITGCGFLPQTAQNVLKEEYKLTLLNITDGKDKLARLLHSHIYASAIFISPTLYGAELECAEADNLQHFDTLCRQCGMKHIIYLALHMEHTGFTLDIQNIIERIRQNSCNSFTALYVPYIYDAAVPCPPLDKYMSELALGQTNSGNKRHDRFAFLSAADLGTLLLRALDTTEGGKFYASGGYKCSAEVLSALFKACGGGDTQFESDSLRAWACIPLVSESPAMAKYGIFECGVLAEEISEMYLKSAKAAGSMRNTFRSRLKSVVKRLLTPSLLHVAGITVLFAIFEIAITITEKSGELSFSDFRLLFASVGGSVYGLLGGSYAALLACAAYFARRILDGTSASVMFYNPENWLPFVFYLAAGCGFGYAHDKHTAEAEHTHALLCSEKEKYAFLEHVYGDVTAENEKLKQRLIGSRESFGKIYSVVKRLNKSSPEEITSQLLSCVSDTLENDSGAVYCIGKQRFARLMACSPSLEGTLAKSFDTRSIENLAKAFGSEAVWKNTAITPELPMYCALICRRGDYAYALFIYNASFEQMNTYYENQIKVLCGLAKQAFVRAADYFDAVYEKYYICGTQLCNAEYFKRQLKIKEDMKKLHQADFLLCRIYKSGLAYSYLSSRLCELMRVNDIAGVLDDGNVYIIFAQMKTGDFASVEKRFADVGITLINAETGGAA